MLVFTLSVGAWLCLLTLEVAYLRKKPNVRLSLQSQGHSLAPLIGYVKCNGLEEANLKVCAEGRNESEEINRRLEC